MKLNKSRKMGVAAAAMAVVLATGSVSVFANPARQKDIGVEKAKQIALKDAGVKAKEASFVRAKLDKDDGRLVYDIEFFKGNVEFDYEIDAKTGKIREKDRDIENYTIAPKAQAPAVKAPTTKAPATKASVTDEKAKQIALAHAGVKGSQIKFVKVELDNDDGRTVYDVEFYANGKEYDYKIDFKSGKILSIDHDMENDWDDINDNDRDDRDDDDRYDRDDDRDDRDDDNDWDDDRDDDGDDD